MANDQQEPKEVTAESFSEWKGKYFPNGLKCDLCKSPMAFMPFVFYLPLFRLGGSGIPSISAFCNGCGQVRQFAIGYTGLEIADNDSGDE